MKAFKKLLSKRGTTITEVLVSILITALSAAMLAMMITTAVNMTKQANDASVKLFDELTVSELQDGTADFGKVYFSVEGSAVGNISVELFAKDDGALTSYKKAVSG